MKLLLLNTCGAEATIALADTSLPGLTRLATMPGRSASEMLVRLLRETMIEAGWKVAEIDAIGVVTGPGSFTGVRVGLSAAKGLGEASGAGLIAVSRLELLAASVPRAGGEVCALLDAGRGEFYCGRYGPEPSHEALLSLEEAVAEGLRSEAVVVCEDVTEKALEGRLSAIRVPEPTAVDALPLVLESIERGEFADVMTLDANYLRRTDAEIFASAPRRAG